MRESVKEKWVEALRSGRYTQGYGRLRKRVAGGDTYCCLGVLCDIHDQAVRKEGWVLGDFCHYRGAWNMPPDAVLRWAGLRAAHTSKQLMSWNDSGTWSFIRIADYIERNL